MTYSSEVVKKGRKPIIIIEAEPDKCELIYGEPSKRGAENLFARSEEFDESAWTKTNLTVTDDSVTSPIGTRNAETLLESTDTGAHTVHQSYTAGDNDVMTLSVYVKGGLTREWVYIGLKGVRAFFNVSTGAKGTVDSSFLNTSIKYQGNGWYRISGTLIVSSGAGDFEIGVSDADNSVSHTGVDTNGVYIWGAQLDRWWNVRRYKKTTASAVSASASGCQARILTSENICLRSEQFSTSPWVADGVTVTADDHPGPNGLGEAFQLDKAGALSDKSVSQDITITADDHVFSVYAKANTGTGILTLKADSFSQSVEFDLSDKSVQAENGGASGSITRLEGDWVRCSVALDGASAGTCNFGIFVGAVGVSDACSVYVWGAQVEQQSEVTPYIATTTASVEVETTGDAPCFNAKQHCQDPDNYDPLPHTIRFSDHINGLPAGVDVFPCVNGINLAPTRMKAASVGERASVSVKMIDFPHHDRGIDPYVGQRSYTPEDQGTFWGKFKARNPFIVNRTLKIKTGYIADEFGDDFIDDFTTRTFVIDSINGPDSRGNVTVNAKDILKLADNSSAKAPIAVEGELEFDLAVDEETSFTILNTSDGDYTSGGGYVRINDEIIQYGSASYSSGEYTLSTLTRAQYGTTADAHDAEDGVQPCLVYTDEEPINVIQDILVNYADIDEAFIPFDEWTDEQETWLGSHSLNAVITEPTGIKDVLETVLTQVLAYMWWDERNQLIKFKAVTPIDRSLPLVTLTDDGNFIEGSIKVKEDESQRLTRVLVYYNLRDVLEPDEKKSFSNIKVNIDSDAEGSDEYGKQISREILTPWATASGPAVEVAGRTLQLYASPPRIIDFKMDAKDSVNLWTGDLIQVETRHIQDENGAVVTTPFIITKAEEVESGSVFAYTAQEFSLGARVAKIAPNTYSGKTYSTATEDERNTGAFIAKDDGKMPNGDDGYQIA